MGFILEKESLEVTAVGLISTSTGKEVERVLVSGGMSI